MTRTQRYRNHKTRPQRAYNFEDLDEQRTLQWEAYHSKDCKVSQKGRSGDNEQSATIKGNVRQNIYEEVKLILDIKEQRRRVLCDQV